jgi:tetratricopeptide (TPR) repeat protein
MLGEEYPSTTDEHKQPGSSAEDQDKYDLAEEMYRQELRQCGTILGQDHPSTLTSTSNLAAVLRDQGKYEQAEETYRQALRLIETVLGKDVEKAAGKRSLNHGHLR